MSATAKSGSKTAKAKGRARDPEDGTTSPSLNENAMDIERDEPLADAPEVDTKSKKAPKAKKTPGSAKSKPKKRGAPTNDGDGDGDGDADADADEAVALAKDAGSAPKAKKRARASKAGGPEADDDGEAAAPKEEPSSEQKKDMRVRARVSGLRKHAGKVGYASRYAGANKSVDGARGLDALSNCLSKEDCARLMRWTVETPTAAAYSETEAMMRCENWGSKLPPAAARAVQSHLEPIFRWAVETATQNTIAKGAVSVSPAMMFQVLRPYVDSTELSHSILPPGLIRELRDEGVIAPPEDNGKAEMAEYRKEWKKADKKQKKEEEVIGQKVFEKLQTVINNKTRVAS